MSSSSKPDMNALAKQFASITGASTSVGLQALAMCNGDLQRAISMHLDGLINVEEMEGAGQGIPGQDAAGPSIAADDSVRAPIPSKMDTLVEDVPKFGPQPRQRRARQSVFDGLRDFQAETRLQEEMIRDPKLSSRKRTLEDLFRPPLDLMHKGTFVTAREAGQAQGKWLMVNVQNVREFSCQALNRDVWSDTAVKSIVRESFIFWQVYHDSDEGRRYMQFYKVTEFPYVSILDPRTGEQMATWNRVNTESFCDTVMQFLCDHKMEVPDVIPLSPPADSPPSTSGPPAKKTRSDSIIDASEESQIEAAIAASLAEAESTHAVTCSEGTSASSNVIPVASDSDDNEDDDDVDVIETVESDFAFSDSEPTCDDKSVPMKPPSRTTNGAAPSQRTSVIVDASRTSVTNIGSKCSNGSGVSVHGLEVLDSSERESNGLSVCKANTESSPSDGGKRTEQLSRVVQNADGNDEVVAKVTDGKVGATEPEEDEAEEISGPAARILLRFPDGRRKEICLSAAATLQVLIRRVAREGFSEEKFELLTNYPRRRLCTLDSSTSLSDAGLCPQESIFVQER